jgi:hypothetical protein
MIKSSYFTKAMVRKLISPREASRIKHKRPTGNTSQAK